MIYPMRNSCMHFPFGQDKPVLQFLGTFAEREKLKVYMEKLLDFIVLIVFYFYTFGGKTGHSSAGGS